MFKQIFAISIKELKLLARDKGALAILFLLPLVFTFIMTFAGVGNQSSRPARILVVNQDQGPAGGHVMQGLRQVQGLQVEDNVEGAPADEQAAERLVMRTGSGLALAVVFPWDFSKRLEAAGGCSGHEMLSCLT